MKTFVILGMHRSATSLISKSLHTQKVCMGKDFLKAADDNPKGFFENKDFLDLNNEILFAAKGNWLEPPSHDAILDVYPKFKPDIINLIKNFNKYELWGWKDPRTTLTIELFHPHLTNPHYISVFRNPLEVGKSLKKRNSCSVIKGINCAREYNYRLIKFLAKYHL